MLTVAVNPHPTRQQECQITAQLLTNRRRRLPSNPRLERSYRVKTEWTVVWRPGEPWPSALRLPLRYFQDVLQWPAGIPEDAMVEVEASKMTAWAETLASVWQAEVAKTAQP